MKVWDEEEVLQELIAVRSAATNTNNNTATNYYADQRRQLPFLLILARKVQKSKCYEFIYYPAETYERIDEVFRLTMIETEDGALSSGSDDDDAAMTSVSSCSEGEEEEEEEEATTTSARPFEPYYVGKAIFHTNSGETLLQIDGSTGWKEALKQNFHNLDCRSRAVVEKERANNNTTTKTKNHTAVKAVASAAIGGTTVVGGTSLAAGASVAMATTEATAGLTATLQTIGAVGVMASPVGVTLAAAGAIGGLGTYYVLHRRNRKKKKEEERQRQELEAIAITTAQRQVLQLADSAKEEAASTSTAANEYQRLSEEDISEPEPVEYWTLVSAKRIELEDSEHCLDHEAWEDRVDADQAFLEVASNTAAKALFDPQGVIRRVDCDPSDRDGWETALSLHFHCLVEHNLLISDTSSDGKNGEHASEDTPLLKEEIEML